MNSTTRLFRYAAWRTDPPRPRAHRGIPATDKDDTMTNIATEHGPGPALMSTGSLGNNKVVNLQGERLGDVKDIMLDMRSGQVSYVVMSSGGFLSIGEKLFAVPWDALKLDTVNECFVLDIAKERLEAAPGFDKDAWPNMANETWTRDIHAYYGTTSRTRAAHLN
jgi:sporulation protein YlmC with PRC-barrel domain